MRPLYVSRAWFFLVVLLAVGLLYLVVGQGGRGGDGSAGALTIDNIKDGEEVTYALLLVKGKVPRRTENVVVALDGEARSWPAAGGRYKVLAMLKPGLNRLTLTAAEQPVVTLGVTYTPRKTDKLVRMVYIVPADGDGEFEAPPGEPRDLASAQRRLVLAGLMLQTAAAEMMNDAGMGRKTFQLALRPDGGVDVAVLRTALTGDQARHMAGLQLWWHFQKELQQQFPDDSENVKNLACMSMTRYDPKTQKAQAHTALGAGILGLFGTGGLHTWAQDLDEVVARWADSRKVAGFSLYDDSALRGTFWANYATGLGATLHELGHAFGLVHSGDPQCVMERGFDHMNRVFMVAEDGEAFEEDQIRWTAVSAEKLAASPWFN